MSLQILKVMFRLRKECHNHDTQVIYLLQIFLQIYEEQIMNWNMTLISITYCYFRNDFVTVVRRSLHRLATSFTFPA